MQSLGAGSNQHDIETQRGSTRAGGREITVEVLLNATKLSVGKNEQLSHYLKRITHLALNGDASKALEKGGSDSGAIHKIQNLHHCPNLKVLYLYDNEVERIENLDAVPQLTHLHLQGNCLQRIENLEPLTLLEKLYLEKNCIVRLEGLATCHRLKELYLANQHVPIDTQFSFEESSMRALASSLRVLDLSNCRVATTKALLLLRCLEQLDLSKNLISDLEEVFALVGGVTSLVELDLRGNEVTATAKYREKGDHLLLCTFSIAGQERRRPEPAAHDAVPPCPQIQKTHRSKLTSLQSVFKRRKTRRSEQRTK